MIDCIDLPKKEPEKEPEITFYTDGELMHVVMMDNHLAWFFTFEEANEHAIALAKLHPHTFIRIVKELGYYYEQESA